MYKYSRTSTRRLKECDRLIQEVFYEVVKHVDTTIITGYRSEEEQNEKYTSSLSKVKWPNSKHNSSPSRAIDASPYPIPENWDDRERFTLFAGYVLGIAASRGIRMRWGGDWDKDFEVRDNKFDDLVHFELID